jgi:hypothetical protein
MEGVVEEKRVVGDKKGGGAVVWIEWGREWSRRTIWYRRLPYRSAEQSSTWYFILYSIFYIGTEYLG